MSGSQLARQAAQAIYNNPELAASVVSMVTSGTGLAARGIKRRFKATGITRSQFTASGRTARRVSALNARTAGYLGMELKFIDYDFTGTVVSTMTGAETDPSGVGCINVSAQGDGESNHDGRSYVCKSYVIKGLLTLSRQQDQADAVSGTSVRVILLWDKQTNGAQFNAEDVLEVPAGSIVNSFPNLQFRERFVILRDRTFFLHYTIAGTDGTNTISIGGEQHGFNWKGNCPNTASGGTGMRVIATGTTAVVASVGDHSLHMMAVNAATGAPVTLSYNSRIRFTG